MNDYNDFYQQSLAAGAQPDMNGGIHHTPASMATMAMNQENQRFHEDTQRHHSFHEQQRPVAGQGFWGWFFNGR